MRTIFALMLFLSVLAPYARAEESALDIVRKANETYYYQGKDGRAVIDMSTKTGKGFERKKKFVILRLNEEKGGEQKYYVYYEEPADIRGTVYMVWKHLDADDDRWLYLPGLNLVTRVAASDKRSSFAGSNFVYEDISGRNINDDTHTLLSEDNDAYTIKSTPKDAGSVEFAYYVTTIRKKDFIPVKMEYFDAGGNMIKTIEAVKVGGIEGHPTVIEAMAKDLRTGGETTLLFSGVEYDLGLTDDIFTERYLQRPPRQWLR